MALHICGHEQTGRLKQQQQQLTSALTTAMTSLAVKESRPAAMIHLSFSTAARGQLCSRLPGQVDIQLLTAAEYS